MNPTTFSRNITDVLDKTWTVFRLSPLYQFTTATHTLQEYSSSLANHMASECASGHTEMVRANIFLYEDADDVECVGIAASLDKAGKSIGVVVVLCRSDLSPPISTSSHAHKRSRTVANMFTSYPVILCKGPSYLVTPIHTWLERKFDSRVSPLCIAPHMMIALATKWASAEAPIPRSLVLTFGPPHSVPTLSNITLELSMDSLEALRKACIKPNSTKDNSTLGDNISKDVDSTLLFDAVLSHFEYHTHVTFKALPLVRAGTPTAFVGNDGKLKIFSAPVTVLGDIILLAM